MNPQITSDRYLSLASRFFVWGLLFALLYILRSFFLLVFLTFIFAYIQARAVDRLAKKIPKRNLRVVLVGAVFLCVISGMGYYLAPQLRLQAATFASNFGEYIRRLDTELVKLGKEYPFLGEFVPELRDAVDRNTNADVKHSVSAELIQPLFSTSEDGTTNDGIKGTIDTVKLVGSKLIGIITAFLLSLLFSFLIVLDLPRLTTGIKKLQYTKVAFVYHEVAGSIYNFCRTLGRSFEAQFVIGILNTSLTALGLVLIGLEDKLAFLSLLVFLCSFIPIAGVFISSIPMCLLAIEEGGFRYVALVIALVTVIHLIEAYVLNPRIFGRHLHLNPVIVIILLTVSGKLFGVWGLVLCLPIATYLYREAIQPKGEDVTLL